MNFQRTLQLGQCEQSSNVARATHRQKMLTVGSLVIGLLIASVTNAQTTVFEASKPPGPKQVPVAPAKLFAPTGFDNNDNVQLVITGALPNTCYRVGPVTAKVDTKRKQILIKNEAYVYSGGKCLPMLVYYDRVVDVGIVPANTYSVIAFGKNAERLTLGAVAVGKATTTQADEYTYVPVKSVRVVAKNTNALELELEGTFLSGCMELDTVRVIHKDAHVFELLPIAKTGTQSDCANLPPTQTPFQTRVTLEGFVEGQSLIHVRSLNGTSINQLVEF